MLANITFSLNDISEFLPIRLSVNSEEKENDMSKRQSSKYKISRRLGVNLWGRAKDPSNVKNYPPGEHGATGRRRVTDYGNQLRAKQQLRGYYAHLTEKQFRRLYKEAVRIKGDTSENIIGLLERQLCAVVYRMNVVPTMFAARQFISHKHVKVNGQTVNIPSYTVQPGDVIEVKGKSKEIPMVIETQQNPERDVPEYIDMNAKDLKATFARVPTLAEVPYPVQMEPNLVVEYYSR